MLGAFIERHYTLILALLLGVIMTLSFLLGTHEGTRSSSDSAVVLSCDDKVLTALAIGEKSFPNESSAGERAPVPKEPSVLAETARDTAEARGAFLGSKNGTKYYPPSCPAAKRIKPENYVWFSDEEDAKLQGYAPATNC